LFLFGFIQYSHRINIVQQSGYRYTISSSSSACTRYQDCRERASNELLNIRLSLMRQIGMSDQEIAAEHRKQLSSILYFCALNVFKPGSPLTFGQRRREVCRLVFDDKEAYDILTAADRPRGRLANRLFNLLVDLRSPLLMSLTYQLLFPCRELLVRLKR